MGRGAARQVRDLYPGVDRELAQTTGENIRLVLLAPRMHLGWIKVKNHWNDIADLDLIERSFNILNKLASRDKMRDIKFHCEQPVAKAHRLQFRALRRSRWIHCHRLTSSGYRNVRFYIF